MAASTPTAPARGRRGRGEAVKGTGIVCGEEAPHVTLTAVAADFFVAVANRP